MNRLTNYAILLESTKISAFIVMQVDKDLTYPPNVYPQCMPFQRTKKMHFCGIMASKSKQLSHAPASQIPVSAIAVGFGVLCVLCSDAMVPSQCGSHP